MLWAERHDPRDVKNIGNSETSAWRKEANMTPVELVRLFDTCPCERFSKWTPFWLAKGDQKKTKHLGDHHVRKPPHLAVKTQETPGEHQKNGGKWMFIHPRMEP